MPNKVRSSVAAVVLLGLSQHTQRCAQRLGWLLAAPWYRLTIWSLGQLLMPSRPRTRVQLCSRGRSPAAQLCSAADGCIMLAEWLQRVCGGLVKSLAPFGRPQGTPERRLAVRPAY